MLISNPVGILDILVLTIPFWAFIKLFFFIFLVHVLYFKLDLCLLLIISILQSKVWNVTSSYWFSCFSEWCFTALCILHCTNSLSSFFLKTYISPSLYFALGSKFSKHWNSIGKVHSLWFIGSLIGGQKGNNLQSALYATLVAQEESVHTPLESAIALAVLTCKAHEAIMLLHFQKCCSWTDRNSRWMFLFLSRSL